VLSAVSSQEEKFSPDEVRFFEAVARWVALLIHREELLELRASL
jgi:GAF domain-containing protein